MIRLCSVSPAPKKEEFATTTKNRVKQDTDLSSIITINGHAETIQRIVDVAKKKAYGINFVIFGLEN